MKNTLSYIVLPVLFSIIASDSFAVNQGDFLSLFEKQIVQTSSYDSLGSLKESIEISTSLDMIEDDSYIQMLNKNPEESFYINADNKSLKIVAMNDDALLNGIFFYLHHLGFRYYFPNPNWHYFPSLNTIFKPLKGVFGPDFLNRRIRYNYGTGSKKADKDFEFWAKANLIGESIPGFTGHSYEQIIKRNKKAFLNHPEYFAREVKKGTIPKYPKFDISNPDLVALVVDDAMRLAKSYYEKYGPEFIISMDPSDGGGYCNKPSCRIWNSPSDQVYYLANEVAKELTKYYPKAYVGLYAYYLHAQPPSFDLEDNIVIYIATAFNQSEYNLNKLIELWKQKSVFIGIRDYYGVADWDWDLPGKGKGTKPVQIHSELNRFYNQYNARFYYIESLNGWITKGIGHYIAARTLWDTSIIPHNEIEEFFNLMFPETKNIMRPLIEDLMVYERGIPLDNDIKQWIEEIRKAHSKRKLLDEQNRIEDVMEYLYAMVLFSKKDENNVESYKDLYKFLYQINDNSNYASYAIRRALLESFRKITPNSIVTTRSAALSYRSSDTIDFISGLDSISNSLQPIYWTPFEFDYQNLSFQDISEIDNGGNSGKSSPISFRASHIFLLEVNKMSTFDMVHGIVQYKNKKEGTLEIYDFKDIRLSEIKKQIVLTPGKNAITFRDLKVGKYWMKVKDNRQGFRIVNPSKIRIAIFQNQRHKVNTFYRNKFYFKISEGVLNFIVRKNGSATIISPTGRKIDLENYDHTNLKVDVLDGEVGFWSVENQKGSFFIDGVLPFFAPVKQDIPIQEKDKKCFLLFWKK